MTTSVYYLLNALARRGGTYVMFDHIRTLRKHNINAQFLFVGSDWPGFEENLRTLNAADVPVAQINEVHAKGDFERAWFIAPETLSYTHYIQPLNIQNLVLHNQNPLYTHYYADDAKQINAQPNLKQIIVPSHYTKWKLQDMGINRPIDVVLPYIPDIFQAAEKPKDCINITCYTSKRADEIKLIQFYFESLRGTLPMPVNFFSISGSREDIAQAMAKSHIFLSLAKNESLGLMALESMASGCHVVGFSGFTEFERNDCLSPSNGDWVQEGEYHALAKKLEQAIFQAASGLPNPIIQAGQNMVNQRYRYPQFEAALLQAIGHLAA